YYSRCSEGDKFAVMDRADEMVTVLEGFQEHEIPRFQLQYGRLAIPVIRASGYHRETLIGGMRLRFLALLYKGGTTYIVGFQQWAGHEWIYGNMDTSERLV